MNQSSDVSRAGSTGTERLVRGASVAASAGLAVMLAATLIYIAWPRISGYFGAKPAAAPAVYAAGDRVDVPAAWYAQAPHTLIVFARASCTACERAKPFLKTVVARMDGKGAAVMAHPAGAPADDQKFAQSLGVADDHIFLTTPGLRVRATPTMVLVDRQGKVIGAWEGAGKPERQAAILKAVDEAIK
jgi:peroxiredoxin